MEVSFYLPLPSDWIVGAFAWWWIAGVMVIFALHVRKSLVLDGEFDHEFKYEAMTSRELAHGMTWLAFISPILLIMYRGK